SNFLRQVSVRYGGRYLCDVTYLVREVSGETVHVVREVFPRTGYTAYVGLTAQLTFRTYFFSYAGYLFGEGGELVHHRVNRILELGDVAFPVYRNFLRKVAVSYGGRYLRDVTYLVRKVSSETVHVIGEVFPRTGYPFYLGLTAELSFVTYLF